MAAYKQSIEEQVENHCKEQLRSIKTYTKTESINPEIDDALRTAPSKKGGKGNNYPDIKCVIETKSLRRIPVMIEVKGKKGDLVKFDDNGDIANTTTKGEPDYTKIAKYAVNGAVHYANAILNHSNSYREVLAIGVNGYKNDLGVVYEYGVYYISADNLFLPKKVGDYSDLSFLLADNVEEFVNLLDNLSLTDEELEHLKSATTRII